MDVRYRSIIPASLICFGLAACGGGGNSSNGNTGLTSVTLQSVSVTTANSTDGNRGVPGDTFAATHLDGSNQRNIPAAEKSSVPPNKESEDTDTVVAAASSVAAVSSVTAIVPINAGLLAITPVSINPKSAEQYDPHVDGDIASYSELDGFDSSIHYYQFSTGLDATVPRALAGGVIANDFLSDVQGSRIVFNRFDPTDNTTGTMFFDISTASMVAINPQPGSLRFGISIGADTVAYAEMNVVDPIQQIGDIYSWNILTHEVIRLTNDMLYDDYPSVSPAGDVIVWEKCKSPFTECEIMMATPSTNGWTVSVVADTTHYGILPSTSSTTTAWQTYPTQANPTDVYGLDIYWTAVGSSAIQRLQLTEDQYHPSVAGNVIVFESQNNTTLNSDIYLYDIGTNRVFQITNTPMMDESLSGITLLPNGELRIVWQAYDLSTPYPALYDNIYSATFRLPAVACGNDKCDDDKNGQHKDHHEESHDDGGMNQTAR